jgi:hypothetical protein
MTLVTELLSLAVPTFLSSASPVAVPAALDSDLGEVAAQALAARELGVGLDTAVRDPRFPDLQRFHQDLRDALFVEIPAEARPWIERVVDGDSQEARAGLQHLGSQLMSAARPEPRLEVTDAAPGQQALAELLVFESVRLSLLISTLGSTEYETVGGEESDIDTIAWQEVAFLLGDPALDQAGVRPLRLMFASAAVALAKDAAERSQELRRAGTDLREELRMRARLRQALRELRLPEAVLLENALSPLLGEDRVELGELQSRRPLALEGLSRQAMDQRVSRGRRALHSEDPERWPKRRGPALFDLLRTTAEPT